MNNGIVKWFDATKGYGFITGEDGKNIFVHQSSILMKGFRTLEEGQKVSFDETETEKGFEAYNVQVVEA